MKIILVTVRLDWVWYSRKNNELGMVDISTTCKCTGEERFGQWQNFSGPRVLHVENEVGLDQWFSECGPWTLIGWHSEVHEGKKLFALFFFNCVDICADGAEAMRCDC